MAEVNFEKLSSENDPIDLAQILCVAFLQGNLKSILIRIAER